MILERRGPTILTTNELAVSIQFTVSKSTPLFADFLPQSIVSAFVLFLEFLLIIVHQKPDTSLEPVFRCLKISAETEHLVVSTAYVELVTAKSC